MSKFTFAKTLDEQNESYQSKQNEFTPPEWVVVGESVLIRPYNISGVVSFIGPTHFQVSSNLPSTYNNLHTYNYF